MAEAEDGMGFSGLAPTAEERRNEAYEETRQKVARTREAQLAKAVTALKAIIDLEPAPFVMPADWAEQIATCSECQRYKDHPIQQGICDMHRRPLDQRERHNDHQQKTLIYRAQEIAHEALSSEKRPIE